MNITEGILLFYSILSGVSILLLIKYTRALWKRQVEINETLLNMLEMRYNGRK